MILGLLLEPPQPLAPNIATIIATAISRNTKRAPAAKPKHHTSTQQPQRKSNCKQKSAHHPQSPRLDASHQVYNNGRRVSAVECNRSRNITRRVDRRSIAHQRHSLFETANRRQRNSGRVRTSMHNSARGGRDADREISRNSSGNSNRDIIRNRTGEGWRSS